MTPFLESAVKVSVIVALALAAAILLRQRSAALRHWVLAVGVASAALTPVLGLMLPAWHAPGLRARPAERVQAPSPSSSAAPPQVASLAAPFVVDVPARAPESDRRLSGARVAGTIWLAGAGLSLAVLFVGLARLSWLASRARPIVKGHWAALAGEASRVYGLRRGVLLLQSDHPSLLVTWGFARPVVILPQAARGWSEARARIVLSHELAHIDRGDWIAQMAAELLRAIYWFNPLLWIVCRRLRDESERACDDAVLGCGIEGPDYAAELLELAKTLRTGGEKWLPAPAMARASSLEGRVAAMLNTEINRTPIAKKTKLSTACALIALALAIAGFSASAQTFSSFSGSVVDQLGGAVSGVTLTLTNQQTRQKYEVRSSSVGSFEFVGLTPGEYELETRLAGFRTTKSTMTIGGKDVRNELRLEVGSLEETITIVGRADASPIGSATPRVHTGPSPKPIACVVTSAGGMIAQPTKIADAKPISPGKVGVVVLDALIGTDGTVREARPVDANVDPDLAAAAIEAVKLWQYTPTLLNCVPIEVQMKVRALFKVE